MTENSQSATALAMAAKETAEHGELLKRLDPIEYFEQFLGEGIYPDGRDLTHCRHTSIECGGSSSGFQGSAYVHQAGGAYVSCGIQLSLAPDSDDPLVLWELEGTENVPKDLLENAQAHLQHIFDNNLLLRPETLRTVAGTGGKRFELRWTLHMKIMVLSWDGLLLDAILTAVQAAMLDTRIPTRVEYADSGLATGIFEAPDEQFLLSEEVPLQFDIEKIRILEPVKQSKPLELHQLFVYIPFLLVRKKSKDKHSDERLLLCDPTAELCNFFRTDRCELILDSDGCIHSLSCSLSSGQLEPKLLEKVMILARQRHTAVSKALSKCVRAL